MANEESTTLQNILAAGKEEFLEKGFNLLRFAISSKRQELRQVRLSVIFPARRHFLPLLLKNMQRL